MKCLLARLTLLPTFVVLFQTTVIAQPDYSFKNAVLVSGTALQTGAKYKFSNVKEGVDAIVSIKTQTGGITLTDIDNNSAGFDEAFQPFINVGKSSDGYVEFQVDFVNAGTNMPDVQLIIPITSIDVDGAVYSDGVLHEQDQVKFFPGNYGFTITGANLRVVNPPGWIFITNTSGASHPGIDTTAKDVMATVVNKKTSSFLLRIGSTNTSPTQSEVRLRSIYFKSFNYGHPLTMPNRTMLSLSGTKNQKGVELKGTLSASHPYNKMIIERSSSTSAFSYIGEIDISGKAVSNFTFTYIDTKAEDGVNYYRIRFVGTNTNIQEITNILMVKMDNNNHNGLEIFNNILQGGYPVLTIRSPEDGEADLQTVDMSGHIVNNIKTRLNTGFNNISLPGLNTGRGYFIIVVRTKNQILNQKIMVQ